MKGFRADHKLSNFPQHPQNQISSFSQTVNEIKANGLRNSYILQNNNNIQTGANSGNIGQQIISQQQNSDDFKMVYQQTPSQSQSTMNSSTQGAIGPSNASTMISTSNNNGQQLQNPIKIPQQAMYQIKLNKTRTTQLYSGVNQFASAQPQPTPVVNVPPGVAPEQQQINISLNQSNFQNNQQFNNQPQKQRMLQRALGLQDLSKAINKMKSSQNIIKQSGIDEKVVRDKNRNLNPQNIAEAQAAQSQQNSQQNFINNVDLQNLPQQPLQKVSQQTQQNFYQNQQINQPSNQIQLQQQQQIQQQATSPPNSKLVQQQMNNNQHSIPALVKSKQSVMQNTNYNSSMIQQQSQNNQQAQQQPQATSQNQEMQTPQYSNNKNNAINPNPSVLNSNPGSNYLNKNGSYKRRVIVNQSILPASGIQNQQQPSQQFNQQQSNILPNPQRVAPSRGGGPSTYYYDDNHSVSQNNNHLLQQQQKILMSQYNQEIGQNNNAQKIQLNINMQTNNPNIFSSNQKVINPRDISFHNNAQQALNGNSNQNQQNNQNHANNFNLEYSAQKGTSISPTKKTNFNGGQNGNNQNQNQRGGGGNRQVERIQITIPNPLLMPNATVQIQYQQELVRNVLQRVDDIFHLKQIVDLKNNKLKDKALASNDNDSTNVFDEVKNRELQRINKENSMLQRFKDARIEDKLLKKQFVKGCRKISLAFKGVVEEDEELERDLTNQKELLISEVSCLEIMGENLTRKIICNMTCKQRLVEACLKEKDYDPFFSISLVLQSARNSFMREVCRHLECYADNVESQSSSNLVRRILKNMTDNHFQRRVKLFKETKIDKYFKLLLTFNEESKKHIITYKIKYQESIIRQKHIGEQINIEIQRLNRERKEESSMNRNNDRDNSSGGGSRVRASVNRDVTPIKIGKQLQMNSSLSSSESANIVNIKNQAILNGRNIKTPQSINNNLQSNNQQNTQTKQSGNQQQDIQNSNQKPTRLTLRMLSQNNKQKIIQQQQQQLNMQMQQLNMQKKQNGGLQQRKSQQMQIQDSQQSQQQYITNTSRKSLKQLQQIKKNQQKGNGGMEENQQSSSLTAGQEDRSTQNSNKPDFNSKMQISQNGVYNYIQNGHAYNDMLCMTPPLTSYMIYQTDMNNNRPKWFFHYMKLFKNINYKIRRHTYLRTLQIYDLQKYLSVENVIKHFWQVKDDERQKRVLTFVLIRNLLRIQNFFRSISKMRNDAALRIQRTRKKLKQQKNDYLELEQKVDQLQYRNQLKKIQKWVKGQLRLIKSKKSKVNPAVEQVLRDPERVQNSKMIQEILIPIVLKIQRAIRFWIYQRKYLPYLNLKRLRDKVRALKNNNFDDLNKQFQPNLPHESYMINQKIGYKLNMKYMPLYFEDLNQIPRNLPIPKPGGQQVNADSYNMKKAATQVDRKKYNLQKQLNDDDIKTAIKSRIICERRLEQASDQFNRDIIYQTIKIRTQNLINMHYI